MPALCFPTAFFPLVSLFWIIFGFFRMCQDLIDSRQDDASHLAYLFTLPDLAADTWLLVTSVLVKPEFANLVTPWLVGSPV